MLALDGVYNAITVNGVFWFLVKTIMIIFLMLIIRGINPRIRIDILLHTGWYKLIVFNIHKSVRRIDVDLRWNYWTGGSNFE